MLLPYEQLPPKLRRMPEVRAQYLTVELLSMQGEYAEYQVSDPFSHSIHLCKVYADTSLCDCTAASFGNTCKHTIAALSKHAVEKERIMMNQGSPVSLAPEPVRGKEFEPEQPVILEDGFYAMFLSRFSAPKLYEGFNGTPERKTFLTFLVTHGINERVLPRFTIATIFTNLKWFYSATNGMESKYFSLYHALLARKYTKEQLFALPPDQIPTLDTLVGKPLIGEIAMPNKADKDGIFTPRVREFKPVSDSIARAIVPTFNLIELRISEKNGFPYIAQPKAEFQAKIESNDGSVQAAKPASTEPGYDYSDVSSEIPF